MFPNDQLNNVLFNVSVAAMAEVLPVATRLGLDPRQFCNGAQILAIPAASLY